MSDLSALSDEDLIYLHDRSQITTQEFADALGISRSELESQLRDRTQKGIPLEERANTGDANTANLSAEEFQRQAEANAEDEDSEEDEDADYSTWTNDELRAEIQRRNDEEGKDLDIMGKKAELIAVLEADDEEGEGEGE